MGKRPVLTVTMAGEDMAAILPVLSRWFLLRSGHHGWHRALRETRKRARAKSEAWDVEQSQGRSQIRIRP